MKKILLFLILSCYFFTAQGQKWENVGGGIEESSYNADFGIWSMVNDTVHHYLYIGGQFDSAGHIESKNLARWDGFKWSSIGNFNAQTILALCMYNDTLVLGFLNGNILFLDSSGNVLHAFKSDGQINALTFYNNELYVGGEFDEVNSVSASAIARYDGSKWNSVDSGLQWCCDPFVQTLYVWKNKLYAGGGFSQAGDSSSSFIASWNDTTWAPLGTGVYDSAAILGAYVLAIGAYNKYLYAGGDFTSAGGIHARSIAKWDGTKWYSVGSGTNPNIYSFMEFKGNLYLGGLLDTAGGLTGTVGIAKWNDTIFSSVDLGTNGVIFVIDTFNNHLYIGGGFDTAGRIPVSDIAVLEPDSITTLVSQFSVLNFKIKIYPNPFSQESTLQFSESLDYNSKLTMTDLVGREVDDLVVPASTTKFMIRRNNLPDGMYFYKLTLQDGHEYSGKIILVK